MFDAELRDFCCLSLRDLRVLIAELVHLGWRPMALARSTSIREVMGWKDNSDEEIVERFLGFEATLESSLQSMGDNRRSQAARVLIGVAEASWGQQLKHRRAKAARHLQLAVETVTRFHEKELLDDITVAIFRQLHFVANEQCP